MQRYRYNVRVGLMGLTLGVLVLVSGILIGHGEAAAALSMAVLLVSIPGRVLTHPRRVIVDV